MSEILELEIYNCYFMWIYHTEKAKIPDIHTYIYLGKDIYSEKRNEYYFQKVEAYLKRKKVSKKIERDGILILRQDQLYLMNNIDLLISRLQTLKSELKR